MKKAFTIYLITILFGIAEINAKPPEAKVKPCSNVAGIDGQQAITTVYNVSGIDTIWQGQTATVVMDGSDVGFNYQLILNGEIYGPEVAGNGLAITWTVTNGGTYTVLNGYEWMNGNAVITLRSFYNVSGSITICQGQTATVEMDGSDAGFDYQLLLDGVNYGSAVTGNGSALSWNVTSGGTYSVISDANAMNGNPIITIRPLPGDPGPIGGETNVMQGDGNIVYGISDTIPYADTYVWNRGIGCGGYEGNPDWNLCVSVDFGWWEGGTFAQVTVHGENQCGSGPESAISVRVREYPHAPTSLPMNPGGSYCEGGAGYEISMPYSESWVVYTLSGDNGLSTSIGGNDGFLSFGLWPAGHYTIEGSNFYGYAGMTGSADIIAEPAVEAELYIDFTPSNPGPFMDFAICEGTTALIHANHFNGGENPVISWTMNGVSLPVIGDTFLLDQPPGLYGISCILTSSLPCVSNNPTPEVYLGITVESIPDPPISSGNVVVYNDALPATLGCYTISPEFGVNWYDDAGNPLNVDPWAYAYTTSDTGTYFVKTTDPWGCESQTSTAITLSIVPDTIMGNIKIFLEGLYSNSGIMNQVQNNSVPVYGNGIAEILTVELHDALEPYGIAYTFNNAELQANGTISLNTQAVKIPSSYYIVVKHRNSIDTWSAQSVDFNGQGPFNYDFSVAASQAYGDNQKLKSGGIYAIFGGDATQDGIVDGSDMSVIDTASKAMLHGYYPEDMNGDGIVDGSDMAIIDNNSAAIVQVRRP